MKQAARVATRLSRRAARGSKPERLRDLLSDVWALVRPRGGLLALGFVLMVANRLAGLVLPGSTKFLVDDVIGGGQVDLLAPLVGAVLAATLIQGLSSYALVQLLSRGAQQLITEMRVKVQQLVQQQVACTV